MQPAADVFKLFTKENVSPGRSDLWVFLGAPIAMFIPAALVWLVIPFAPDAVVADLNVAILFFVAITSIGALGVVMAGYGSRSAFSLLGALRGAAQMISYEVPLILSLLGVVMLSGSLSLTDVVRAQGDTIWTWYFLPQLPMFLTFYISGIAEVKRVPFDLPEGESEIVGGFMIEYSGMTWALIQAAEFASMAVMSAVTVTLFLGAGSRLCPSWTSGISIGSGSVSRRRSSCLPSSGSGGAYPVSGWTSSWTWAGRYWFR